MSDDERRSRAKGTAGGERNEGKSEQSAHPE